MKRKLLMKQVMIAFTLSLFFLTVSAQSQNERTFLFRGREYVVNSSVAAHLGNEKVQEYSTKAPLKLLYYNFYKENSYLILNELPAQKGIVPANFSMLPGEPFPVSEADFNILKTTIEPSDKNQFFKLNNQFIMVYPQATIDKNFDRYIESLSN